MEVNPGKEPEGVLKEQVHLLILPQKKAEQVVPPQRVLERVPQELEEQEPMEVIPRKEPEEVLKEQVPLPILPRKKEVPVVLPQQVLEQVPQELGEE